MGYSIELTQQDIDTIYFVGGRYCWSDSLQNKIDGEPGTLELEEHEAWGLNDDFESDTEGGHSLFPMLDPTSALASKLYHFMGEIV